MARPQRRFLTRILITVGLGLAGLAVWGVMVAVKEFGPRPDTPPKAHFPAPTEVCAVAFRQNGRHLAAGGRDGVTVWDRTTRQPVLTFSQVPDVQSVGYSPDGGWLAILARNGNLTLWDADTGALLRTLHAGEEDRPVAFVEPDTDTRPRTASVLCFSPDGRWLVTGHFYASYPHGTPGEVRVWDAKTGQRVQTLTTNRGVTAVAFNREGNQFVSGDSTGGVRLWDVATWNRVRDLPPKGIICGMGFTPDRQLVSAGGWSNEDATVTVRALDTGAPHSPGSGRPSHAVHVNCLTISPDGHSAALGELVKDNQGGERIRVWRLRSGELVADYGCAAGVVALAYSPDGRELAAGCKDGVRIWDAP